jgi:hypothetical protein
LLSCNLRYAEGLPELGKLSHESPAVFRSN